MAKNISAESQFTPAQREHTEELCERAQLPLFTWWQNYARDLPWRNGNATPWGILVCEVMSQQTQMSRVVPYWNEWMQRWPDAASVAQSSTAEVITAWGRLGYPRRALRLQECARVVAEQWHNQLPHSYDELIALPGIGDYTASAVMSFAFGERIAVVDTNIRRVLSRAFLGVESLGGSASSLERALAVIALPQGARQSVLWNQSVMELGAIICTAKQPQCDVCPLRDECLFLAAGLPHLGEKRTRPRQRFAGTDRQLRGSILNELRKLPAGSVVSYAQLAKQHADHVQLDRCIASLDEDGLIEMVGEHDVRLPQ